MDAELICQICGVSFNIARIRRQDEPPNAAWSSDGYRDGYVSHPDDGESGLIDPCEDCKSCMGIERANSTSGESNEIFGPWRDCLAFIQYNDKHAYVCNEHIAGPECQHECGYNGHHISVEEMRGCTTVQCLVLKPSTWKPEEGDADFEITGNYFLSGIGDHVSYGGETRWAEVDVTPVRHGCDSPPASNWFLGFEDDALPFHPACLEVYKRACFKRHGKVDISLLTDCFSHETPFLGNINQSPAVRRGHDLCWRHIPGDEFLAANPLFPPAFFDILEQNKQSGSEELNYHRGVFDVSFEQSHWAVDCFAIFPPELCLAILAYLDSKDIASLRLASHSFCQLPQSLFHRLIVRELPWLWEAWCDLPYAFWATTTEDELLDERRRMIKMKAETEGMADWLRGTSHESQESDQGIGAVEAAHNSLDSEDKISKIQNSAAWLREEIVRMDEEWKSSIMDQDVVLLKNAHTNWYGMYRDIKRRWAELKGLQNRERIWIECEEILNRVEDYTTRGMMGNGVVIDVAAIQGRPY